MDCGKTIVFKEDENRSSNLTCLICHKKIKTATGNSTLEEPLEVLKKIASVLQVSTSIYHEVDWEDVPVRLLCSSCNETISDAIQLQEAMKTLQNQLKKLTRMIKRDFLWSFKVDTEKTEDGRRSECEQVELIRRTYAQCWTTCEVKITPCNVSPELWKSSVISRAKYGNGTCESQFSDEEPSAFDNAGGEADTDWDPNIVKSENIDTWEDDSQTQENAGMQDDSETDDFVNDLLKHPRRKPAQCKNCGRFFTRVSSLKDHLRRKKACSKGKFHAYRKGQKVLTESQFKAIISAPRAKPTFKAPIQVQPQIVVQRQPNNSDSSQMLYLVLPSASNNFTTTSSEVVGTEGTGDLVLRPKSSSSITDPIVTTSNPNVEDANNLCGSPAQIAAVISTPQVMPIIARKPVKCKRCGKLFTKIASLRNHMRKKNPCLNLHGRTASLGLPTEAEITEENSNSQTEVILPDCKSELISEFSHREQDNFEEVEPFNGTETSSASNSIHFLADPVIQLDEPHQEVASEIVVKTTLEVPRRGSHNSSINVTTAALCSSLMSASLENSKQDDLNNAISSSNPESQPSTSTLPFVCPTCPMQFASLTYMQCHVRMNHTDIQCKSCGEVFTSYGNLMKHRRELHGYSYTNKRVRESKYKCDQCHKSYTKRANLRAHIMEKHQGMKKALPCPTCHQTFPTKHQLNKHIEAGHGQHRECKFCGENMLEDKMPHHLELHNGHPDFPCYLCPVRVPTERSFIFHLKRYHGISLNEATSSILSHGFSLIATDAFNTGNTSSEISDPHIQVSGFEDNSQA